MVKMDFLAIIILMICLITNSDHVNGQTGTQYVEFSPPFTVWLTESERIRLSQTKGMHDTAAYKELKKIADESMSIAPDPLDTIFYEGLVSNHPRRIETVRHLQDIIRLRALTWCYVIGQEELYGRKAADYLIAWADKYVPSGNDVNDNKLEFCFFAADVLQPILNESEKVEIFRWLTAIADAQRTRWKNGGAGNRMANRLKMVLMYSLHVENPEYKSWADEKLSLLMDEAFFPDGTTSDFHQRDAMHYHVSCVNNFLKVGLLYRVFGEDIYSRVNLRGGSVKKSVDFVIPYALGEKIHPEWVHTKVDLDRRRWLSGDPYYKPGKPWDPSGAGSMFRIGAVFDPALGQLDLGKSGGDEYEDDWNILLLEFISRTCSGH